MKEIVIDFVDIYKSNDKMTDKVNKMIRNKIEKEKTSLKIILKREFIDLIIGMILILACTLVKKDYRI